mmetsp:Transcript_53403/g.108948  ORF Transcript_53403/g.108948 Transcript_53403/m.108948 type:complete len:213 (+) Transcript_53403:56-694(+)
MCCAWMSSWACCRIFANSSSSDLRTWWSMSVPEHTCCMRCSTCLSSPCICFKSTRYPLSAIAREKSPPPSASLNASSTFAIFASIDVASRPTVIVCTSSSSRSLSTAIVSSSAAIFARRRTSAEKHPASGGGKSSSESLSSCFLPPPSSTSRFRHFMWLITSALLSAAPPVPSSTNTGVPSFNEFANIRIAATLPAMIKFPWGVRALRHSLK